MKTKDQPKKQTGNKAETKLAKFLKTIETLKKQSGNKPENKARQLIENAGSAKNKPETERRKSAAIFTVGRSIIGRLKTERKVAKPAT